jgi:hypothetical protein
MHSFNNFPIPQLKSYQWEGKEMGKGHGRVNMVQILCTYVCKWKNDTVETSQNRGGGFS